MKKCPPGVICVENITILLLVIIIGLVGLFIYMNTKENKIQNNNHISIDQTQKDPKNGLGYGFSQWLPSWPYTNIFGPQDILLNPYAPPFRDERYFVPINVSTNVGAVPTDTPYRQVGILTPLHGSSKDSILPLMGRPLFTTRDKWQYYTISNQHNNIKLPIKHKGRNGLNEYGINQIFSEDVIYVEGNNEAFKVKMYENDTIRYLPYL